MTEQTPNIIASAAMAVLVVGATGCKCVSGMNSDAGIPAITSQPMEQEVELGTNGPHTATFHVSVKGEKALRFAWYKVIATADGTREEPQFGMEGEKRQGGLTQTLIIPEVEQSDAGLYYCDIAHEAGGGLGDVVTRTRLAPLIVFASTQPLGGPQVSSGQLQGSVPGSNVCAPGQFADGLNFTRDNTGKLFTAAGSNCDLTVAPINASGVVQPALPYGQFGVCWTVPVGFTTGCADITNPTAPTTRSFKVTKPNDAHTFFVYFKNAAPVGAKYQLTVQWTP
jgi:hypothetical protein